MTTLTGFGGAGAPARVRCPSLRPAAGRFPGRDQAQAQDAAFLAGYLEAFGEFKEFVDYLSAEKKVNAEFRQQIDRLLDRQMEKYFTFAEQINTPERYDGGHDETAISGRTLDCEGGAKDGV